MPIIIMYLNSDLKRYHSYNNILVLMRMLVVCVDSGCCSACAGGRGPGGGQRGCVALAFCDTTEEVLYDTYLHKEREAHCD